MPLVRCMQIYALLMMYNHYCTKSSTSIIVYIHLVGLIRVARFDLMGNAKAFESWNERQELAPRPFLYGMRQITTYRSWSHAGQ